MMMGPKKQSNLKKSAFSFFAFRRFRFGAWAQLFIFFQAQEKVLDLK